MDEAGPIRVHVLNREGYVWDIDDITTLRRRHRLIGAMVGGLQGFQAQVSVHGPPLQLSPEEVTLALQHGWIELYTLSGGLATAHSSTAGGTQQAAHGAAALQAGGSQAGTGAAGQASKRPLDQVGAEYDDDDALYAAYYDSYYADEDTTATPSAAAAAAAAGPVASTAGCCLALAEGQEGEGQGGEPSWQAAVASGAHFQLPATLEEAAEHNPGAPGPSCSSHASWRYPSTPEEALQFAVFADLYERGYTLTSGAKFGGLYLAYPGPPELYHGQFVVRVVPWGAHIAPHALKAWARVAHGARKHLLLASAQLLSGPVDAGIGAGGRGDQRAAWETSPPIYITVAKETGFVSSSKAA